MAAVATTIVVMSIACATSQQSVQPTVEWKAGFLLRSDQQALLTLARQVGFPDVHRVSELSFYPAPAEVEDAHVVLESAVSVDGQRRSWFVLRACNVVDAHYCDGPDMVRVGRWTTSKANIEKRERWRIEDGQGHIDDVGLGATVSYADAAKVALAIRLGTLINRLESGTGAVITDIPDVRLLAMTNIDAEGQGYKVSLGSLSGFVFYVRILDGRVELYRCDIWTA